MKNLQASIKARLLNISRSFGIDYNLIIRLYMQEGILRRISKSSYASSLYLKGGLLLYSLSGFSGRPTKDIDFLGTNISAEKDMFIQILKDILSTDTEDGLSFFIDSITIETITEEASYQGQRVKITCTLGAIRNVLQLDIGFGDIIMPGPVKMDYPTLLTDEKIQIYAYSVESIVAEKFEAMIVLDARNSRMKDFYDIYQIITQGNTSEKLLTDAIRMTFQNRRTPTPVNPAVFDKAYGEDPRNKQLWDSFLKRINSEKSIEFKDVLSTIQSVLEPIYREISP
ncbi:MAG: nucleotidyl transferase AbiEii/AbiGii toxin family protein [Spirochaetales bacterium]|nr:nucleotidyl transferase AbiEii/AbiGii toxin family protein [Spirochaetales bacterium]